MDRELTNKEINTRRRKKVLAGLSIFIVLGILAAILMVALEPGVKESDLKFATADRGIIETTITATGKVTPAFEEIINSPINSRIMEVYCKAGDSVSAGTPLMRLDLQSAETELRKLSDEHSIKQYGMRQNSVAANTSISNLEMQIKVKEMSVNQMREDVVNERRLDSIGSGTGERIRQAELTYNTALLELEQLRQQLANEKKIQGAQASMKQLELNISASNISLMQHTLDDANLKAPRRATLTFIVNEIGRQVSAGEQLAVIADLEHFKVDGQIADSYAQKFGVGSRAIIQIGKERIKGTVTNIVPQSQGGAINFTLILDEDNHPKLRSGLSAQVYVLTDIKEDVVRIPNFSFYNGPGLYNLFVREGSHLEQREVQLGQCNYDYVEVVKGLEPGAIVVINDMKEYSKHQKIKIN